MWRQLERVGKEGDIELQHWMSCLAPDWSSLRSAVSIPSPEHSRGEALSGFAFVQT